MAETDLHTGDTPRNPVPVELTKTTRKPQRDRLATAVEVANWIKAGGIVRHGCGQSLWLQVRGATSSWMLRYRHAGQAKSAQRGACDSERQAWPEAGRRTRGGRCGAGAAAASTLIPRPIGRRSWPRFRPMRLLPRLLPMRRRRRPSPSEWLPAITSSSTTPGGSRSNMQSNGWRRWRRTFSR